MKFTGLIILCISFSAISLDGQTDQCRKSTEGKDFWLGFMECRNYEAGHYVDITLTSVYTCSFDVYIGKSKIPFSSGIVFPNVPRRVTLDWHQVEAIGSETIQSKGIHLVSDNPLNVYALSWASNSSDAAVIFPTESLGNEYYAMCYDPHISSLQLNGNAQGKNSEFLIVASEDNTLVGITTTKVTDNLRPANIPFSINLNKGEVYQVQSENLLNTAPAQGDLTGSHITSNKPVALFSGSYCTTVPKSSESAWNHLYEQIPPLQTWGRKFVAVPLKSREKDTYRILASEDNTEVRVGSTTLVPRLKKGEFREFMLNYNQASLIESDKPVLLAQFSNSNSVDIDFTGGDGDPFMIIVSPVNQTREKVTFVAYDSKTITNKYFVNVIVKDDAIGKIYLDGGIVGFQTLTGAGYSYAQIKIGQGNHILESTSPGKGFIAYVYGFGGFDSYGYGVGFNLDIVLDLGSNINSNGEKLLVRCDGAGPATLNAGNGFDNYLWNTGEKTSSIQVTKEGLYKVLASTKEGCVLKDSVKLLVSKPVINLGPDTTVCNTASIILDAGDQFTNYLWSTTETGQKIVTSTPGKYTVEATNKYGCKAYDDIRITFADKPKVDFSGLNTFLCGKKTEILNVKSDKSIFTVQRLSDNFTFNGLEVSVPDYGTYLFKIKATNEFSCHSDSIVKFEFHKTPTVDISVDSMHCYGYNLDINYLGNANINESEFIWIFGGDTIKRGIGVASFAFSLGINSDKRDLKLIVDEQGCSNEKTLRDVKVIPNLKMAVIDRLGCEPFAAKFIANNTETVNYDWDFGDGNVLSGATSDPSHTYQNHGYYAVKLKVTTSKGCSNEVRIDSMVYVAPVPTVGFSPGAAECLSSGDHEISYSGTGDPSDNYKWDLSAFDSNEVIINPKNTQGPLVFNLKNKPQAIIGLKAISKYGCQSKNSTILATRKPSFSINSSSNTGCPPFEILFSAETGDVVDKVGYSWNFGDGTIKSGDKINHLYEIPNHSYDVVLTGLSSVTGCSDTIIRRGLIRSYPIPTAEFGMDNKIVYNDKPNVNFLNSSSGANSYLWKFGDGSTSDLANPSHYFKSTGHFNVLLEVFNEFFCSDTVSHRLLVAFDRIFPPNAFSPNAPNIVDREFRLASDGIAVDGYHLRILSRWSDVVFEIRDEIKGWDGRMQNGSPSPSGTYVWILNFTDFLGRKHRQTGTVTLIY